ncbi:MAG: hypothetical protein AAGE92_08720 [Cyanobacteria bacterium P01_G01_bin.4]
MPKPLVTGGGPEEAFVGDVLVCTFEGEHLDAVTEVKVAPAAKGVVTTFGDPHDKLADAPQQSSTALTVTIEVGYTVYPGEKRIELISPEGASNPLPFLIMM